MEESMDDDKVPQPPPFVDTEEAKLDDEHEEPIVTPGGTVRTGSKRHDHLKALLLQKQASLRFVNRILHHKDSGMASTSSISSDSMFLTDDHKKKITEETAFLRNAEKVLREVRLHFPIDDSRVEVRMNDFFYKVKVDPRADRIQTVYNESFIYDILKWFKRVREGKERPKIGSKAVLENVNLVLKPGKMYLVLGPPGSGKTTLLRSIAGRLSTSNGETIDGSVTYNGLSLQEKTNIHVENAISYIDQLDFHAPRLTVRETFSFAFQCKTGGTHAPKEAIRNDAARELVAKLDAEDTRVNLNLEALGLVHVANTFVGNADVRGVSGGQRRRVTVGEMLQNSTPILCGDEISTGLDAASTYDIIYTLMHYTRLHKMTRIISLLQPSPETVSLFDEVILLSEGKVLFAGPIGQVEDYFESLGYHAPDQMDIADFLQMISTPDGAELFTARDDGAFVRSTPYSMVELADLFQLSDQFQKIKEEQSLPWGRPWETTRPGVVDTQVMASLKKRYANSFMRSIGLNLRRNLTIWSRDTRFLIANAIKNVIMGLSVGGVFWQTDNVVSVYGVLFQITLFIMLGAMVAVPEQVSDRIIYYKHTDANFYSAFPYVIGKALALVPQSLMDVTIFGTIIYWMVGLAPAASNFFIYITVLFVFTLVMNQMLSVFAAFARTKSDVQGLSACILLLLVLFCGFIVAPDVIPDYYIWIYWWNPLAWAYRALLVNELLSSNYDYIEPGTNVTVGDYALVAGGFLDTNGDPFQREWIGYAFAYLVPYTVICVIATGICLLLVRVESEGNGSKANTTEIVPSEEDNVENDFSIPFKPVTLTFESVCYDVKASKGKSELRLLHDVNGIFGSGRMCALMGSSGAGKTTLMDVIALRKNSGKVSGDIRLNGFQQESQSFRRCSGYVEQFDVQAPELTVRETVLFSARLRLDSDDPATASDEAKQRFVDQVIHTLELSPLADSIVGSDDSGGLSFEQRKRLSIAVELAASPSIIFLDEPTSGLDARAALIVVKALRRIADTGRTVIATIHQPSSAVFEMFDDLLLLKKGGRAVFFGELGEGSQNLLTYFESRGAHPIDRGENPANWMLTALGTAENGIDFADDFLVSEDFERLKSKIREVVEKADPNMKVSFDHEFAAPQGTRRLLLNERLSLIYWRSPAYNLSRMLICLLIAFILGSVFVSNRRPTSYTETEISSIFSTIFIAFIIIGVLSITSVLPVMLKIRDSFYKHRASGMIDHVSLALALGVAEKWFIVISSFLFCVVFIPTLGIHSSLSRDFAFWGFFTFNVAIYSYFGQAFMCIVRGMPTAQILASVFIGLNNFFSGLIVRPQYLTGFFAITYWITPGHYVYEGLIVTQFYDDDRLVVASPGSAFYESLACTPETVICQGTVSDYVDVFFGGKFQRSHVQADAIVLGFYLTFARVLTYFALKHFNFTAT